MIEQITRQASQTTIKEGPKDDSKQLTQEQIQARDSLSNALTRIDQEVIHLSAQWGEPEKSMLVQDDTWEERLLLHVQEKGKNDSLGKDILKYKGLIRLSASADAVLSRIKYSTSGDVPFFDIKDLNEAITEAVELTEFIHKVVEGGVTQLEMIDFLFEGEKKFYLVTSEFLSTEKDEDLRKKIQESLDESKRSGSALARLRAIFT